MDKRLKDKFIYALFGYLLVIPVYLLRDTQYNIFGIFSGIISLIMFIKALLIRPSRRK